MNASLRCRFITKTLSVLVATWIAVGLTGCSGGAKSDATSSSSATPPSGLASGGQTISGGGSLTPSSYVPSAPPVNASDNFVTVKEADGIRTIDYPVQLGRVFLKGEIANYPQALVDGKGVETQADVKTRWPDGSVKHAILSFYVPTLDAGQSVRVTFTNQSLPPTAGLTNEQMLASEYRFDSVLRVTAGQQVASASARQMLSDGHVTRWLSGPVSTSVVLADHSSARTYDLGFDAYRSLRPIFHATFWPRIKKVFVRVIGETSNPDAWQTLSYDLTITGGTSSPATIYSRTGVSHHPAARWTRTFWIGDPPSHVDIDHNLRYLAATGAVPNFDSDIVVAPTEIQNWATEWNKAPKGILDSGNWEKAMFATGGRPDIGPYPTWVGLWLYSGDHRMESVARGNADLAGAWPFHFRESKPDRIFEPVGRQNAQGRVLSVFARPTLVLGEGNVNIDNPVIAASDGVIFVGGDGNYNGWVGDTSHQPDPYSVLYTLSGDYWYLEQMQFWASWGTFRNIPASQVAWSRGPQNTSGGLAGSPRDEAWGFRTRAQAAWFSPDGSAEKVYFERQLGDAIAIWEGRRNIRDGVYYNSAEWQWGLWSSSETRSAYGEPTLGMWSPGVVEYAASSDFVPGEVAIAFAPWMDGFMMAALGRARELGYPTDALIRSLAPYYTRTQEGTVNAMWYASAYAVPAVSARTGKYFQLWPEILATFTTTLADRQTIFRQSLANLEHGYATIACAAITYIAREPGGGTVHDFCVQEQSVYSDFSLNPKWAILPR